MATRARLDLGPTGEAVALNLARLRADAKLSLRALADRMPEHHPIRHVAIGEIERGERRVTVDDLTALAAGLGVSPVALLQPPAIQGTDEVALTGMNGTAWSTWHWLLADRPTAAFSSPDEVMRFRMMSYPRWELPPEPDSDDRDE